MTTRETNNGTENSASQKHRHHKETRELSQPTTEGIDNTSSNQQKPRKKTSRVRSKITGNH